MVSLAQARFILPAAILLSALVSGCIEDSRADVLPTPAELEVNPALAGDALQKELESVTKVTKDSSLGVPSWTVGEFWVVDVFFGESLAEEPLSYTAVVYEAADGRYMVGSDNRQVAVFEAFFDLPMLGEYDQATLDTTSGGEPFRWYNWPLADGKTWKGSFDFNFDGEEEEFTFHAAFKRDIPTPEGNLPGFQIHGIDDRDVVLFEWDYVPALHWANHIFFYNEEDPTQFDIHLMVRDHGYEWKGALTVLKAEPLIEEERHLFVDAGDPTRSAAPTASPVFTFDVSGSYDTIEGFAFVYAFGGVAEAYIESPSGKKYEVQVLPNPSNPAGFQFKFHSLEKLEAEKGTWRVLLGGAGVAAGAGALLSGMTDLQVSL